MFEFIKKMFISGRYSESTLTTFVTIGWITEAQKNEIIGTTM